jgi:Ulp1 family protease
MSEGEMSNMEFADNAKGNDANKSHIQVFTETAETIAEQSKRIRVSIEDIIQSCRKNDTIGAFHKDALLTRMDNLKRLASLCDMASGKIMNAAKKLAKGTPEDEVLSKVSAYTVFLNDQLNSQENEAKETLDILRNSHG